jgi:DNA-binding protein H-NS
MADIDLESMSLKELEELESRIASVKSKVAAKSRKDALNAAKAAAAQYGFNLADLSDMAGGSSKGAKKASGPAKYRNPENAEETWTGKGRRPTWFINAIDSGVDENTLLV